MRLLLLMLAIFLSEQCWSQDVPEHASKNSYGDGWACNEGFYRSGRQCQKVKIPKNAGLDVYGSDWKCNEGFKRVDNACLVMIQGEQKQPREKIKILTTKMQCLAVGTCNYSADGSSVFCGGQSVKCAYSADGSSVSCGGQSAKCAYSADGSDVSCGGQSETCAYSADGKDMSCTCD